jgi:hypothetical protein
MSEDKSVRPDVAGGHHGDEEKIQQKMRMLQNIEKAKKVCASLLYSPLCWSLSRIASVFNPNHMSLDVLST